MSAHLCVGVPYWQLDELAQLIATNLEMLGCQVQLFEHTRLPPDVDVVFAYGPLGSLTPLATQLLACTPTRRPSLVLFLTEQLPSPQIPEFVNYHTAVARSQFERFAISHPATLWGKLAAKALRFRYYGDLHWLRQQGILSLLLLESEVTAEFLRQRGFRPYTFSLGSRPDWGADLNLERDIPVLWLGKAGSPRRQHLLNQVRAALQARGVEMMVVDGVERPYIFGHERTVLLNRTQVVLNLVRQPWDCNSLRFYLAAPNKAMMISEPLLPHVPAIMPAVHYMEAPVAHLPDLICSYLARPDHRQRIAAAAYELVTTQLTTEKAFRQILRLVEQAHGQHGVNGLPFAFSGA
jgi:hypothetical protein